MTTSVEEPTTIRFARGQRKAFDALARRRGVTRSILLRQAVAAVLAVEQDVDGQVQVIGPQRVRVTLPVISDDASDRAKERRMLRNLTALSAQCPGCGIKGRSESAERLDVLPRTLRPRVVGSTSRPARRSKTDPPGSTISTSSVNGAPEVTRSSTVIRYDHDPTCVAAEATRTPK